MPIKWKLFRIACILQLIIALYMLLSTIANFVYVISFRSVTECLLFLLVAFLAIFAINLVSNNYPDTPVTGAQKKNFNRLFLANFVFLMFLFAFIFAEIKALNEFAERLNTSTFNLKFSSFLSLIPYILTLIFQFIILYGLFVLRQTLYLNFTKRKFEFEK